MAAGVLHKADGAACKCSQGPSHLPSSLRQNRLQLGLLVPAVRPLLGLGSNPLSAVLSLISSGFGLLFHIHFSFSSPMLPDVEEEEDVEEYARRGSPSACMAKWQPSVSRD